MNPYNGYPWFWYKLTGQESHKSLANLIIAANDLQYANDEFVQMFDFVYEPNSSDLWFAVALLDKSTAMHWRLTVDAPDTAIVYYGDSETGYDEIKKLVGM